MKAKTVENKSKVELFSNVAVIKATMVGIISIVLGAAQLFQTISPFQFAFLCGVPLKYGVTALIGSVISCVLFASPTYKMYYIISLCAIFAVRMVLSKIVKGRAKPLMLAGITMLVTGVISITYSKISGIVQLNVSMMFIEAFLASSLTYFYAIALNTVLLKKRIISIKIEELTCIGLLVVPLITAMASISIFRVSVGVIIGVVAIYIAIARYGVVGASVSSIIVAISINLYSLEMMEFAGMLIICAFIAGVFAPTRKLGIMAVFVATNTFALFLLGAPIMLSFRVIEILFATAIFMLVPQKYLTAKKNKIESKSGISPLKSAISSKLTFASSTIKDLQEDLVTVSKKFDEIDSHNISTVYDCAANRVCKGCTMQLKCWDDNCNDTIRAFYPLNNALKQYSKIDVTQMPTYFQENCCKLDKLTNEVNNAYHAYSIKEGTKRNITESRGLIIDQFNSMADMLLEVSDEFAEIKGYDENTTNSALKAFAKLCNEPTHITATQDRFGRTSIEIYTNEHITASKIEICEVLSDATDKDFDLPCISTINDDTKVTLFEKARYTVDFSAEQKSCNEDGICGDCYEYFCDGKGYAYCILSDGMGSGKRAAIDSVMTCSILLKLIKAGFSLDSSLKLINSSLLVKSADESLATIDVVKIDLFTGETKFYKAGAASSYISTGGNCVRVDTRSLPVGIIREVEFEQSVTMLKHKDVLLMVSDGLLNGGEEWITKELTEYSHMNAKEIARKIIFEAQNRSEDEKDDDQTVIVCKLKIAV